MYCGMLEKLSSREDLSSAESLAYMDLTDATKISSYFFPHSKYLNMGFRHHVHYASSFHIVQKKQRREGVARGAPYYRSIQAWQGYHEENSCTNLFETSVPRQQQCGKFLTV